MLKRHTFWLWTAVVFLFLTGAVHSIGLFVTPTGENDTERQMLHLMMTYKQDMFGFHPTMWNLFIALSSCFTFLCLLAGLTISYLLRKRVAADVLKGIVTIELLVLGVCFVVMCFLTFLLPILFTGLCVLFLLLGLATIPRVALPSESVAKAQ
jgi:hypothetical protein